MTSVTSGTMCDREMVTDLLSTEKQLNGMYNTYAGECKCVEMRDTFLNILKEGHCMQSELFTELHSRGWYPTKEAPVSDISTAKQKFTSG